MLDGGVIPVRVLPSPYMLLFVSVIGLYVYQARWLSE